MYVNTVDSFASTNFLRLRISKQMATLFFLLTLLFCSLGQVSLAMSSARAVSKDQITCTMCSSCDNPCQPIYSPPQPPPVKYPPPPSPPSGGSGGVYYFPPPPPAVTAYYTPPYGGGGSYPLGYGTPPPPNPIVSYFPFFYHTPPPPSAHFDDSHSVKLNGHHFISSLLILFSFLVFV